MLYEKNRLLNLCRNFFLTYAQKSSAIICFENEKNTKPFLVVINDWKNI